jgi:hypothetical protein
MTQTTMTRDELEQYVDASSRALGMRIEARHRDGVVGNLEAIFAQAGKLMPLALDPLEEAAPVFRPEDPSAGRPV